MAMLNNQMVISTFTVTVYQYEFGMIPMTVINLS